MNTDIIFKILGLLSPLFTFLIGFFISKIREYKQKQKSIDAEQNAIKETCKMTLRKSLKDDYEFYTRQGFCSVEDKAEVRNEYDLYHKDFNGNGRGTLYFKSIMKLPDQPINKED